MLNRLIQQSLLVLFTLSMLSGCVGSTQHIKTPNNVENRIQALESIAKDFKAVITGLQTNVAMKLSNQQDNRRRDDISGTQGDGNIIVNNTMPKDETIKILLYILSACAVLLLVGSVAIYFSHPTLFKNKKKVK